MVNSELASMLTVSVLAHLPGSVPGLQSDTTRVCICVCFSISVYVYEREKHVTHTHAHRVCALHGVHGILQDINTFLKGDKLGAFSKGEFILT